MTNYKADSPAVASSVAVPTRDYKTDFTRFEKEVESTSTGLTVRTEAYSLFLSDNGGRIGSYSITASQEAYLALNLALSPKGSRR